MTKRKNKVNEVELESEIKVKGLKILNDLFSSNGLTQSEFIQRLSKAKLGMAFYREINLKERVGTSQRLRIIGMISTSPIERRKYIKISMPKYFPA